MFGHVNFFLGYVNLAFHPQYFVFSNFCQVMFGIVNFWTVSIHDGVHIVPGSIINGTAHHNEHHEHFVVNYGQFFTFWDRVCGTYLLPGTKPSFADASSSSAGGDSKKSE